MDETRVLSLLRSQIEDEISERKAKLVSAQSPDHAHYTERCGQIRGLELALQFQERIEKDSRAGTEVQSEPTLRPRYED